MSIFKSTNFWGALSVAATLAIGVVIAIALWGWLRGGTPNVESNGETIRNVGLLIGAAIALVFAIWRTIEPQQQFNVPQRGLLNDCYQKGAEMLGNNALAVRLGGIYALRSLAEEHSEQYHVQVMSLLRAFVRHPIDEDSQRYGIPSEDILSAMYVIVSSDPAHIELKKEGFVPNLSPAILFRTNLSGAVLTGANLSGAGLSHAEEPGLYEVLDLTQAQLDEAVADPDNPPKLEGALTWKPGSKSYGAAVRRRKNEHGLCTLR